MRACCARWGCTWGRECLRHKDYRIVFRRKYLADMDAESAVGPFGDNAGDFEHLNNKIKIKLLVRWEDEDYNERKARDEIELSRGDSLFERLDRRVTFRNWERLSAIRHGGVNGALDVRSSLYTFHGNAWFDDDPAVIRRGAREAVDHLQEYLHDNPSRDCCVFVLDVKTAPVIPTAAATLHSMQACLDARGSLKDTIFMTHPYKARA